MSLNLSAVTNGTVTSFDGASGMLETMLAFILGTEVIGATTSGSGLGPYTATLTTPVGLGRAVVSFTISSVSYTVTDDGTGNFTHAQVSSSSLDHATGAFTITFVSTPDSTPTIDYLYGEPGQDWRLLYKRNTRDNGTPSYTEPFGSDCKECIIHNTGLSGSENILIGFREWKYVAASAWGIDLTGYITYSTDQKWWLSLDDMGVYGYDTNWEHFLGAPNIPLIDDTMYYWLYSNQQRICLIVKCSLKYEGFYVGFGNRFGNPDDYPYPLIIIGTGYGNVNINSSIGTTHSFIPFSNSQAVAKHQNVTPSNTWVQNWLSSGFVCPMYPVATWDNEGQMFETPPKKEVLFSPVIQYIPSVDQTLSELDDLYHASGVGLLPEDVVRSHNGKKYRIFPNISNTDYDDFMAIAEADFTTTSTSTTTTSSTTTSTSSTTTTTAT